MATSFFDRKNAGRAKRPDSAAPSDNKVRQPQQVAPAELSTLSFSDASIGDAISVQESETGIGAVFEEAAVLYANGNASEAEDVLRSILDDPDNTAGEGLWMMLIDLYRLTGQQDAFESKALDYATRFERSPPQWEDLSTQTGSALTNMVPVITINGGLTQQAEAQIQQAVQIGRKRGAIRIDLKRVRIADAIGCALLRDALKKLMGERIQVFILNSTSAIEVLSQQIETGTPERRDIWLLLLELLQHTDQQDRFEEIALDYAITFEESPPSWERRKSPEDLLAQENADRQGQNASNSSFPLSGIVAGMDNKTIKKLVEFAANRNQIQVDCSNLQRLDFVNAGVLFNIIGTLQAQGKRVTLQNVNAMVAALLRVMGVDQVAVVTLRVI